MSLDGEFAMNKSTFQKYMQKYSYNPCDTDYPKQLQCIMKTWELLDKGDSAGAATLMTEYRQQGEINIGEPVLAILRIRVGRHFLENKKSKSDFVNGVTEMMVENGGQNLIQSVFWLQQDLVGSEDPRTKQIYLDLSVMMRYGLYHFHLMLTPEERNRFFGEGGTYKKYWDLYRSDLPFDYTGVDPFILELCPPEDLEKKVEGK